MQTVPFSFKSITRSFNFHYKKFLGDYLNDSIIKRTSSSSQLNSKQVTLNTSSSANPSPFHSNSSTNNLYSESTQEESYLIDLNTQKYILDRFNSPMTSEATAAVKTNFIQITDYLYIGIFLNYIDYL